ncbi:hypothetical protein ACLI4R_02280 [Natrialbaceae archaeon A-chndr2]
MSEPPRSLDRRLRRVADNLGFALLWGWILISLFFVPTWLGYWWVGALLFAVGLLVCWQAASATTHPVSVIGTRRSVSTAAVTDETVSCDECGGSADGGERRRYTTRHVLFGTTVAVPEWGENVYCPACLEAEREPPDSTSPTEPTEYTDSSELEQTDSSELARESDG